MVCFTVAVGGIFETTFKNSKYKKGLRVSPGCHTVVSAESSVGVALVTAQSPRQCNALDSLFPICKSRIRSLA